MTVIERIRAHLYWKLGIDPVTLDQAYESWSPSFEQLMRNRMAMGRFRYGPMTAHLNTASMIKRLRQYERDGNQEHLVDVANIAMVEYMCPGSHPNPRWAPVDDGEHTETL